MASLPIHVAESLALTMDLGNVYDVFDYLGFAGANLQGTLAGIGANPFPYWRDQTKRGEAIPLYLSELELKIIRDRSRVLCATNEFAISALANRRNYVIGSGLSYRARPADEDNDETQKLCEQVQQFIDLVREVNDFPEREAESCWRNDEDGEAFVRLFPQTTGEDAGMTYVRFVEPELVRSPTGDQTSEKSFGIETVPDDIENIRGYSIIDDPLKLNYPSFVPESEVVHFKSNTRTTAKRGLPVLYPVEANIKRAGDLLMSMTSMAKTRAKIAMIRRLKGTGKTAAQSLADSLTETTVTDPLSGVTRNIEHLLPGTILTADGQKDYEFPHAQTAASEFVLVLDAELRAISARLQMPEWMLSANAGNANYSSTFVAESGVVKAFQFLQDYYKRKWGEGRYGQKKSIMWRCIDHAIKVGILPETVRSKVRILVEAPQLEVRDRDREASLNKLYNDMRVKSRATIQQEIGLDGATEDRNIESDTLQTQNNAGDPNGTPKQGEEPPQSGWDDDNNTKTRLATNRDFSQT